MPFIAGPTSADGTPSLAAVVASIDADFVQFPASMELQASKQEVNSCPLACLPFSDMSQMIQNFTGMMIERLKLYEGRNKSLPERVILFRDGVSEGQFDTVLQEELPQIREAFRKVYKEGKKPLLMICICGKRHHARFYPANSADETRNGNTKPGTIVDKGIGDVYRFDFYLQAHAGLQGTVRLMTVFGAQRKLIHSTGQGNALYRCIRRNRPKRRYDAARNPLSELFVCARNQGRQPRPTGVLCRFGVRAWTTVPERPVQPWSRKSE